MANQFRQRLPDEWWEREIGWSPDGPSVLRKARTRFDELLQRANGVLQSSTRGRLAVLPSRFDAIRFKSVRCGKSPIPMWLKAESTRMQFTRFPGRCATSGTTHGVYLLHGEFFGFHSDFVFLLRRWLDRHEENFPFCWGHLPAENLLESTPDFFRVKQFLT